MGGERRPRGAGLGRLLGVLLETVLRGHLSGSSAAPPWPAPFCLRARRGSDETDEVQMLHKLKMLPMREG